MISMHIGISFSIVITCYPERTRLVIRQLVSNINAGLALRTQVCTSQNKYIADKVLECSDAMCTLECLEVRSDK